MPYTIKLTNGNVLVKIPDGSVTPSTICSLTLIGQNYSGFGAFLNDNLVHLLENFSSSTAPSAPLQGQLWWDTAGNLKVYTGSTFKTLAAITSSSSAPSGAVNGNGWWDTANQQYHIYNGSQWILIGPAFTTSTGTSGTVVGSIIDDSASSHVAVNVYVSNSLVGIISKDSSYTPQTTITGFPTINPGFNLASQSAIAGIGFWGTASNASALSGIPASSFIRSDQPAVVNSTLTVNNNSGLIVGTSNNFIASVSGTTVRLTNNVNNADLVLRTNVGGTPTTAISIAGTTGTTTVVGSLNAANYLLATQGDDSTSATTGAARITGGLGVTGNVVAGGNIVAGGNVIISGNASIVSNVSVGNITAIKVITTGNITAGNLITSGNVISTGNITTNDTYFGTWGGSTISIQKGGTGQTTASGAINALVPNQSGNGGKVLTTDGSSVSWGSGLPIGSIIFVAGTSAPSGFIKANGTKLDRTTYAALWAYAQTSGDIAVSDGVWQAGQFSPGDGSTDFRIPDLRGNFVRPWADDGSVDTGRGMGTLQLDEFRSHYHNVYTALAGGTRAAQDSWPAPSGWGYVGTTSAGGAETRPRNVALLACIKY